MTDISANQHLEQRPAGSALPWNVLRIVNLFRAVAAGLFVVLYFTDEAPRLLGNQQPAVFVWTSAAWFLSCVMNSFTIYYRQPGLTTQTYLQLAADLAAIVLLQHASGGIGSGLGAVLVISVTVGSLLLDLRMALLFAALAALAVLGEQLLLLFQDQGGTVGLTQGGIVGAIFFVVTMVGHTLARRVRESEELAEQRGVDLANLAELNDYIIQHLQSGVLVVDAEDRVRLINSSACQFLGVGEAAADMPLRDIHTRLARLAEDWRAARDQQASFTAADGHTLVVPHFAELRPEGGAMLVFLEDSSVVAERVRQMKLTALGRLTASIAHEIRNPLGAASHANQLLRESGSLTDDDRHLTHIIGEQTQRMNQIVENILQLSRRENVTPERLELVQWLRSFREEFTLRHGLPEDFIRLDAPQTPGIEARMDPSQLHQVLWNLTENALRYGAREGAAQVMADDITLCVSQFAPDLRPAIEISDRGPGITEHIVEHIFEPFYSGNPRGTGLGLFIARELCECNHATLSYQKLPDGGACFRITFADPDRWVT